MSRKRQSWCGNVGGATDSGMALPSLWNSQGFRKQHSGGIFSETGCLDCVKIKFLPVFAVCFVSFETAK
jgi:hypothetical protein